MSCDSSSPKSTPVVEYLDKAKTELQVALEKLEEGEVLVDKDVRSSQDSPPEDPDDLAALFFAQQALKKEMETKLPINAWAKTIHATVQHKSQEPAALSPTANSVVRQELSDTLQVVFEKAFAPN